MRFATVRDLRSKSAELWRDLAEEREMVVTNNGRPVAVLAAARDDNVEEVLRSFRRDRALAALEAQQVESVARGAHLMTLEEINAVIDEVRRELHGGEME
jgi:antitoxin (DNA-binding transcriptional repressor) of toxin-antitoxin stability system